MGRKILPARAAKRAPLITMMPAAMRHQLEQVAHRERVSLSEIGRRALVQFLETAGKGIGDA